MGSKKKDFGGCRDIISDLPDAVICHILSFLPTKEAASTTVLAKRWKPLLRCVPSLEFDDSLCFHPPMTYEERSTNARSFMRFVDGVALQGNAKINRFHFKGEDIIDQMWVLEMIPNVLKRGVSDLDLDISSIWDSFDSMFYHLPPKIFVSETLVRLKLKFVQGVNISVEGDVSLPISKILHLDYFKIVTATGTFNKLLSGCHALEELLLYNLMWDKSLEPGPFFVNVSIPTLKRLTFRRFEEFDEAEDFNKSVSLSIFENPNLVYIEYIDSIADRYQQVSFDSLVEASLGLRLRSDLVYNQRYHETEYSMSFKEKSNVTTLLTGICNVKILCLSDNTLEVLGCCRDTIPVFNNLIELTIETKPDGIWKSLPAMLKNCPNLVTLVFEVIYIHNPFKSTLPRFSTHLDSETVSFMFQGMHHIYSDRCEDEDGCLCRHPTGFGGEVVARTCLSSSPVKVLKILNFGEICDDHEDVEVDDEDEEFVYCLREQIEHVEHFIEKMPNLEQVILHYYTSNDEDVMMKVFKKLEKLPRVASANCKIQLISDNLSSNASD
ncbi:LOW QUALITY PROTEIN: putative F-box/LRR-repeat protein At5g41630 [Arabidopsis lyrata subsp. lyrata]|uniref:LOW QUALITY PROTEIN: putative F-box/LRR-repeat protein At5g41630 n=1 Tax=Arabidopsis lyrata subsp. lyrata TaxID=81972 RepID=UPI000A29B57F|nr:LOW QUALITY PROTEIN: putative F-box/LRR-repeat protein At5g41630 [Arabidopsis lyrata subsp. lyrata]|eukprot:XP_020875437.1 LOW QUALITY PROTEIN: putative F-box/LRR-repeat protein At5g41630 [Arabidopsis lyrata subsp. lyrata]